MFQPSKWWVGLPVLGLLWLFANASAGDRIERDLSARVLAALPQGLLDKAGVAVLGRDATLSGAAFDPAGKDAAMGAIAELDGLRPVNSSLAPLPAADPYAFSATLADNRLILAGAVPNPAARASVLAAARAAAPKAQLVDQLAYAGGAPANFEALAAAAMAPLANLTQGAADLKGAQWSLSGEAATSEGYEKTLQMTKAAPAGLTPGKIELAPPLATPYAFSAAYDGKDVELSGAVPSIEARSALVAKAAADFPGAKVASKLAVARGASAAAVPALGAVGLGQLARLAAGKFEISDTHAVLTGVAKDADGLAAAAAAVRSALPDGFDLAAQVSPPPASPYVFSAERSGSSLTLSGYVPDDSAREQVMAAARKAAPEAKVADQLSLASGAPPEFLAGALFAAESAGRLSSGQVALSGQTLSIQGEAGETAGARALAQATAPQGFSISSAQIRDLQAEAEASAKEQALKAAAEAEAKAQALAAAAEQEKALKAAAEQEAAAKAQAERDATAQAAAEAEAKAQALAAAAEQEKALKAAAEQEAAAKAQAERDAAAQAAAEAEAKAQALAAAAEQEKALKAAAEQEAAAKAQAERDAAAQAAAVPASSPAAAAAAPNGFSAVKTGDKLVLSGMVRNEAAHRALLDLVDRSFLDVELVDHLQISAAAPETLAGAAERGLQQLARLESGALATDGAKLHLEGAARFAQSGEEIKGELSAASDGPAADVALTLAPAPPPVDVAACGALIGAAAKRGRILFDTAKASIHKDSVGMLDFIAASALRCPAAHIEIDGHTDSDGGDRANLELSQRRAEAVAERLAKAGVPRENLVAKGFGESKPIAGNDTPEGKALNRRIEFAVTE